MDQQLQLGENNVLIALKRAWDAALRLLAPEISRPSFESFFKTAKPVSIDGKIAVIGATSELAKIFLEKYTELIRTALESSFGAEIELFFVVTPRPQSKARAVEVKEPEQKKSSVSPLSLPLNDKYIFRNFITGACNKMAHASARMVGEKPGQVYNPFFLYGGPGLGKTHLLHAIAHHALETSPGIRVAYVSGELFTSHYVMALREHRSEDFRRKYRSIDLLLIDDVQFLAGKEKTKEEFFHTFNALYQTNKQIVLCSDRAPRDLDLFEDRLRSRFESGLVVDIAPPSLETRIAILQKKALSEKAEVPLPVLECVANLIQTNVRALEGAIVTLLAYTSLMKAPLTVELAREILDRYLLEKKCSELTPDAIQRTVARAFDVEVEDLRGVKRQKDLVTARHTAIYLCRELTNCSLQAIGKAFGDRDHATILHACNRIKNLIEEDGSLKETIARLSDDLKAGRY